MYVHILQNNLLQIHYRTRKYRMKGVFVSTLGPPKASSWCRWSALSGCDLNRWRFHDTSCVYGSLYVGHVPRYFFIILSVAAWVVQLKPRAFTNPFRCWRWRCCIIYWAIFGQISIFLEWKNACRSLKPYCTYRSAPCPYCTLYMPELVGDVKISFSSHQWSVDKAVTIMNMLTLGSRFLSHFMDGL